MMSGTLRLLGACLLFITPAVADGQASHSYQTDFSREELTARRTRVLDAIGPQAIAIVQGASGVPGFSVSSYLVGVTPTDPVTFAGVPVLLLGVSAVASYLPAQRAAAIAPVEALREE